ncbi:MAG: ABC transporter permease subunit [Bacteroidales bacterium]|nr:ABC transporter permease subunit [Bacteroidales bacterium]
MKYSFIATTLILLGCIGCSKNDKGMVEPRSEADLAGLTVATTKGSYYHNKLSKRTDIQMYVTNSDADCLQAVRQGSADVFVGDEVMLTKEDQKRLGMKKAFIGEEAFDAAFALKKGNDTLRNSLNKFLAVTPVQEIIDHWINDGPAVEEPEYTIDPDAQPLRCVSAVNVAPICFVGEGGKWRGMDPDILSRFAHSLGRPIEMKFMDLGSAIIELDTGKADIFSACLFATEERKKAVDFSSPYYNCHPGYFIVDKDNKSRTGIGERLKNTLITDKRWKLITDGLLETVKITLLAILLGTILGAGVCACRRSRRGWLRSAAGIYSGLLAGIPNLVMLLIMFYVVFAGAGISASAVAIFTFALYFASSSGSIFDTSISSVPAGQTEAGLSLGFTPLRTFLGIVFPQAIKKGLPLYASECVSLLKSTSIVGYIAIHDLTRASDLIRSRTFDALLPLLIVTLLYFALAWLIRFVLNLFLKKI